MSRTGSARWMLGAAPAVLRRPSLWVTAVRQVHRLARPRWWRRPPFLPLPDADYLHFRLVTMYGGSGDRPMSGADVVQWLEWCRRWPAAAA